MTTQLHNKKLAMHAAETAYHGAIIFQSTQVREGVRKIDGSDYAWMTHANAICVTYKLDAERTKTCIDI